MNCVKLSIVLPAYNAGNTISRAIGSLVDTRFIGSYEIIVVDDGSTDFTLRVCREWSLRHPDIVRVVHQDNAGVSSARNFGMTLCEGTYIAFVDADDYVVPGFVEMSIEATRDESDYITFDYIRESGGSRRVICPSPIPSSIDAARELALTCTANAPWAKLYKNSLINKVATIYNDDNGSKLCAAISFPENQSLGEDLIFNLNYLMVAKTASYYSIPAYVYVETEGSRTVAKPSLNDSAEYCNIFDTLLDFCSSCKLGDEGVAIAYSSMRRIYANYVARLHRSGYSNREIDQMLDDSKFINQLITNPAEDIKDRIRKFLLSKRAYRLSALLLRGK